MVIEASIAKITARAFEIPTHGPDCDERRAWTRVTLARSAPGLASKASDAECFRVM